MLANSLISSAILLAATCLSTASAGHQDWTVVVPSVSYHYTKWAGVIWCKGKPSKAAGPDTFVGGRDVVDALDNVGSNCTPQMLCSGASTKHPGIHVKFQASTEQKKPLIYQYRFIEAFYYPVS